MRFKAMCVLRTFNKNGASFHLKSSKLFVYTLIVVSIYELLPQYGVEDFFIYKIIISSYGKIRI